MATAISKRDQAEVLNNTSTSRHKKLYNWGILYIYIYKALLDKGVMVKKPYKPLKSDV